MKPGRTEPVHRQIAIEMSFGRGWRPIQQKWMYAIISPVEIPVNERYNLVPLFESCRYDRVLIESVLEGRFGVAYGDSVSEPTVARLNSGAFTMLAGDPRAPDVKEFLRLEPIAYVTPQTAAWRQTLQEAFGERISALPLSTFRQAPLIWRIWRN